MQCSTFEVQATQGPHRALHAIYLNDIKWSPVMLPGTLQIRGGIHLVSGHGEREGRVVRAWIGLALMVKGEWILLACLLDEVVKPSFRDGSL